MNFTNCWAKDVLYDASVGKVYVRCWANTNKVCAVGTYPYSTRDISGNWNGDGVSHDVLQYTASGTVTNAAHISTFGLAFGSLLSIASLTPLPGGGPIVVDTLSILPLIAFFQQLAFVHVYALCAPNAGTIRRFYGQINVFEHGYPSAGSFKTRVPRLNVPNGIVWREERHGFGRG